MALDDIGKISDDQTGTNLASIRMLEDCNQAKTMTEGGKIAAIGGGVLFLGSLFLAPEGAAAVVATAMLEGTSFATAMTGIITAFKEGSKQSEVCVVDREPPQQ